MNKNPILTGYVSEIDQLLQKFDKDHPETSVSQQKEYHKAQRIIRLRTTINPMTQNTSTLWEDF